MKKSKYCKSALIFPIALQCILICVHAEESEEDEALNMSLSDILNIEVTSASKIAVKISEAPAVITAYTQEHIQDYGFRVINDLLYTLPGFGPSQDYDRPTISTRGNFDGWNNNHILHLVDGVPVNDNLYGSAYTWLTPTFTTKTMEVIRGPGSALYGSNATNGVVQVNTLKASDLTTAINAKVSLAGTDGNTRHEFLTGAVSGDVDFILAYSFHKTDGNEYSTYDASGRLSTTTFADGTPASITLKNRDNREDSYLWAKMSIGEEWQIQYHRQEWDFDTGHGWVFWIPDFDEEMNESRDIASVKYNANINDNLSHEYVVRYQRHDITWNQRYYPVGAFDGYYPTGMWEYLDTDASDIFVRAQATWLLEDNATVLAGFEGDYFTYEGDDEHFSNINVDDEFFAPFAGDADTALGPWLDYIIDEPIINTAIYAQFTTGDMWQSFELTAGVRWDKLSVDYKEVYEDGQPKGSKSWSKVSPRLAGVWPVSEDVVLKLMWGKAFRAPTPTEMAGAHTFSLASNINGLEPELITTTEFMTDWTVDQNHVMRFNVFLTEFENQIAYSTANANLSTNIYSTENLGLELEFIGNYSTWDWFANVSFVDRQDENILAFFSDGVTPEFSNHPDEMRWEPELKLNAGINYQVGKFNFSATMHYHGEVLRRDSDNLTLTDDGYCGAPGFAQLPLGVCVPDNFSLVNHRGDKLDAWVTFNTKISYDLLQGVKAHLEVKNLFDEDATLIKTGPFPFDFQVQGQSALFYLEATL